MFCIQAASSKRTQKMSRIFWFPFFARPHSPFSFSRSVGDFAFHWRVFHSNNK